MIFKKAIFKYLLVLCILVSGTNICFADTVFQDAFSPLKTINPNEVVPNSSEVTVDLSKQSGTSENAAKNIYLSKTDSFYNLTNATDKFVQCNIKASWDDFKGFIDGIRNNDFQYLSIANKMADLGFFDLSSYASEKIRDKELTSLSLDAMQRFYYPRKKIKPEDELFLAEVYSNITFNNQSSEAINELLQKENLLSNYDYANYLVALGSYKSNLFSQAAKYIDLALLQNPGNLNYLSLKAQILVEKGDKDDALKIVATLKKQNLYAYDYEQKVKSTEQFILYKTSKNQWEKDYHLGYYYYIGNDSSRALRTLQEALELRKRADKGLVYGLMSQIYFETDEFEKAEDAAKKADKFDVNNPQALLTLGDLSYMDKNYKQALGYYKKAAAGNKKDYIPLVAEAKTYQKLSNNKKANEIYTKLLKTHSDSWEAYYNVALLDKNKRISYLKKALAVNPLFEDGWIELAKTQIDTDNYDFAQEYLANAYYINENDFRYYYYQGLVYNNSGNYEQAKYNFKKCLKLNSNYKDAQSALDTILKGEINGTSQGNNI